MTFKRGGVTLTAKERDNRETWLNAAVHLLRPDFAEMKARLHTDIRVSVGFPLGGFEKIAGQFFKREVSKDQHNEIFISPLIDDSCEALGVLVHELIHAQDNGASGHNKHFEAIARRFDLEGKPTATTIGAPFKRRCSPLLKRLGKYPHASLRPSKVKRQGTRLIKCECPKCGYICRVTAKWINAAGTPICPTDRRPMVAEGQDDGDEGDDE